MDDYDPMATLDRDIAELVNAYADGDDAAYTNVTSKYLDDDGDDAAYTNVTSKYLDDDGMADDLVAKLVDVLVEQLDGVRLSFPGLPDYGS
jgi:hypothetical protein